MSLKLNYTTLDVFTQKIFEGNPLAIVRLSPSVSLTQEQKQTIAREFNYSETVFVHESSDANGLEPIVVDIFTVDREIPFAGHPTIGTTWFLLNTLYKDQSKITIKIKAGIFDAFRSPKPDFVRLEVPKDFKIHSPFASPLLKFRWSTTHTSSDFVNGLDGAEPVVSIVKGMTAILIEMVSEDALSRLTRISSGTSILPEGYLGAYDGPVQVYGFHVRKSDSVVRTRMFSPRLGIEDPATGSAASALGGFLALRAGTGRSEFEIWQGVEMGRKSVIRLRVDVSEGKVIEKIELEGSAVPVFDGILSL